MGKMNLSFLSLAHNYLHTSKLIFCEMKISGNKWIVIKDCEITDEIFEEETKWSDYNVIIPGLSMLYHGLELLIKGLLLQKGVKFKELHGIEQLYSEFDKTFVEEKKIKSIIKKYAYINTPNSANLINKLIENNKEINSSKKLYQAFRYPFCLGNIDESYKYDAIFYKEEEIIDGVEEIINDIDIIITEAVNIYRLLE